MRITTLIAVLLLCTTFAIAQDQPAETKTMDETTKSDYSKDHESIERIIAATYDSISAGKGVQRDWDRFRALFYKDARLIPTSKSKDGVFAASSGSPDDYIKRAEGFLMSNGFYEKEIARKIELFGNIAHVFSTYEGRSALTDEKPFLRGINSFQLINDGKRWWVLTIYWQAESTDTPLPEKYLPAN